jgi:hypothetical protein
VADTQDTDLLVAGDTIADDIGVSRHQFAHVGIRHWAASVGEIGQAIAGRQKAVHQIDGSLWVEIREVIVCTFYLSQRGGRPDNPRP